ncbi:Oidioi.mRNA.OKI2018_I69.PAR.g8703.t1.cds [Oikopleura dioica]|uniref:XK-related protein n=1 Tax=Oikopleura dioica TaxID=34765 RepID=A0ABN7RML6_OIKDI|nr:Oidioi.mRNA.OKI2018_I69.PAR.g8703.t1.cds [Oikopleura dioica]
MHILLLGPVMLFYRSWKDRLSPDPLLERDLFKIRFLEGTLEAAPQLLLQLTILSKCRGWFSLYLLKSNQTVCPKSGGYFIASLISIGTSFITYLWVVTEKKKNDHPNQLSTGTLLQIYFLYFLQMLIRLCEKNLGYSFSKFTYYDFDDENPSTRRLNFVMHQIEHLVVFILWYGIDTKGNFIRCVIIHYASSFLVLVSHLLLARKLAKIKGTSQNCTSELLCLRLRP